MSYKLEVSEPGPLSFVDQSEDTAPKKSFLLYSLRLQAAQQHSLGFNAHGLEGVQPQPVGFNAQRLAGVQ